MCTGPGSGQGQLPRIFNRLRDFRGFVPGSTRHGLSRRSRLHSQARRQAIRAGRQALRRGRRVPDRARWRAAAAAAPGFVVDQLVGQQQRREQELARFAQRAEPGDALRGSWRRPAARRRAGCPPRPRGKRPDRRGRRSIRSIIAAIRPPPRGSARRARRPLRAPWRAVPRRALAAACGRQARARSAEAPARLGPVLKSGRHRPSSSLRNLAKPGKR